MHTYTPYTSFFTIFTPPPHPPTTHTHKLHRYTYTLLQPIPTNSFTTTPSYNPYPQTPSPPHPPTTHTHKLLHHHTYTLHHTQPDTPPHLHTNPFTTTPTHSPTLLHHHTHQHGKAAHCKSVLQYEGSEVYSRPKPLRSRVNRDTNKCDTQLIGHIAGL